MEIEVRPIRLGQSYALRQRVLWPQKSIAHVKVDGDEDAPHFGAYLREQFVGCGSFYEEGPRVRLRKLAVLEAHQGQGVGGAIVLRGAEVARDRGAGVLWCDARETAIGFYERLGFVIAPERFEKSGVVYVKAELVL